MEDGEQLMFYIAPFVFYLILVIVILDRVVYRWLFEKKKDEKEVH